MSLSRRAFLGAVPVGGLALSSPWWVKWIAKHFGPTGTIHDTGGVRLATEAEVDGIVCGLDLSSLDYDPKFDVSSMDAMLKEVYRGPVREMYEDKIYMNPRDFKDLQESLAPSGNAPAEPATMYTAHGELPVAFSSMVKRGEMHTVTEHGVHPSRYVPPKLPWPAVMRSRHPASAFIKP